MAGSAVSAGLRGRWLVWLAMVVLVAVTVALSYVVLSPRHLIDAASDSAGHAPTLLTSSLSLAVQNSLDPRYSDANNDKVADPPADPEHYLNPATLAFSYIAGDDPAAFEQPFADLMKALQQATGKQVNYTPFTSTATQLRSLRDGSLHIVGLGTGTVPIAVNAAGFVPLVQPATDRGVHAYQMLIIVPADSPVRKLADLSGQELTLTQPHSNSGSKAPLWFLRNEGLLVRRDFEILYSGGQDQSIRGIADGSAKAAAVASDVLQRAVERGVIGGNAYRVIYTSPDFPPAAIGVPYNLDPELAATIQRVLLNFRLQGTSLEKNPPAAGQTGFNAVDYDRDWYWVRHIDSGVGYRHQLD